MNTSPPLLRPLVRCLLAAGLCLGLSAPVWADETSDRIRALESRLAESTKLIEQLAARLAAVEREKTATPPAPQNAPSTAAADIVALQESVAQLSESLAKRGTDTGLPVHGFADVGAGWSGGADPQKLRGFNGGTLDLYLTPQFGERVKSLVELAVEYGVDGTVGLDMERLQLGYTVSDALTIWVGRFHTPFGLWNTSFHHGANLQTSIYRPRFVDFEDKGGIIAAHSVGVWGSGKTDVGWGKVTYDLYLANGSSIRGRTLDFNAFTDDTTNKLLGGNLGIKPKGALTDWTFGVHAFGSDVAALNADGSRLSLTRVRMGGAYFGYDGDDWEAIGETYRFANTDLATSTRFSSQASFVQVGKSIGQVTPYVRLEQVSLANGDAYFASQESGRSYRRASVGLRYSLDPRSSFKFELATTREAATTLIDETGAPVPFAASSYRRGSFQYSVAF